MSLPNIVDMSLSANSVCDLRCNDQASSVTIPRSSLSTSLPNRRMLSCVPSNPTIRPLCFSISVKSGLPSASTGRSSPDSEPMIKSRSHVPFYNSSPKTHLRPDLRTQHRSVLRLLPLSYRHLAKIYQQKITSEPPGPSLSNRSAIRSVVMCVP